LAQASCARLLVRLPEKPSMRPSFQNLAFALFLAGPLLAGPAASAETWKLGGTGGAMPMAEHEAAEFAVATGIKIEMIPGLGSKGAIHAVADGVLDLAISARPLNADESSLGLSLVPIARTALVFVTSHPKPNSVNSADLPAIFSSVNPKWADGSPLHVILRTKFDADTVIIEGLFPGLHEAIEAARLRPEVPVAPTDQDNAELAESIEGSFVQAGFSQIITEKRRLQFVAIDGVEPTAESFETGKYPYEKQFYLVFSAKAKAGAGRLLDFLHSAKGQSILRETGNLPVAE
jgi:phosphate transport system substrate-binding protein